MTFRISSREDNLPTPNISASYMYRLGRVLRMISHIVPYLAIFGNFLNKLTATPDEFHWISYVQGLG
jgi:hypothetical protein